MRWTHSSQVVTALCIVCTLSSSASAQKWPDPYNQSGTLGLLLEAAFTESLRDCGIDGIFQKKLFADKRKSSVPTIVRNDLSSKIGLPITDQATNSAARIFAYIFASEADARAVRIVNMARLLPVDVTQDPVSMLAGGTSSLAHAQSCRSIIAATFSADAGIKVPSAHVETALSSEFNKTATSLMTLTEGTFASPIGFGLTNALASPAEKLAARLLVWNWYQGQPPSTSPNWYIASFNGGTVYRVVESNDLRTGKVDLSAGAAVPGVASVEAALRASLNLTANTQISRYKTFFYVNPVDGSQGMLALDTLDSPSTIAQSLTNLVRPQFVVEQLLPISDLEPHTHTIELTGVPRRLCDLNFWDVALDAGAAGTLSLPRVDTVAASPLLCRFGVSYLLSALPATGNVQLKYSLQTRQPVGTSRPSFPVSILLNTAAGPSVRLHPSNPQWTESGGMLTWRIGFHIQDLGKVIDFTQPVQLLTPQLTCASVGVVVASTVSSVNAARDLDITLVASAPPNMDAQAPPVACTFTGALLFAAPSLPARTLQRTLPPSTLRFPGAHAAVVTP